MRNIDLDPKRMRSKMSPSNSSGAYETLINLWDKMTHLNGVITQTNLGGIFTIVKTHHYKQGQKYGHLASAIPEVKYRLVITDPTWLHTAPADPGSY